MTIGRSAFLAVAALTAFLMSMPAWQWVAGWSGSGIKETETFSVQSEWRITWETKNEKKEGAGIFQIYVHDENDKLVSLAANKQGVGKDTSVRAQRRQALPQDQFRECGLDRVG